MVATPPPRAPAPASGGSWTPAQAEAVHKCEEPSWSTEGPVYSGGLGISDANWITYGGERDFGSEAAATPGEQATVAYRIQPDPPDQHGCTGGW